MKICFCIGRLSFSGAENVARFLMKSLLEQGHEVSVILLEKMPEEKEMITGLCVKDAVVRGSGIVNILKRIGRERKALRELSPDVFIIFNSEMTFSAVPASLGLRKTKVVVCERNDPTVIPPSQKRRLLRNLIYRFADAGVYQTDTIAAYFRNITKRSFVIENPIRDKYEKCPPIESREKVFVTVARLDEHQKNQSMMIRGFLKAAKAHPEYQLHLLGDGPDAPMLQALIDELDGNRQVKLLGRHPAPHTYIRNCYAFLLTSEFEGMPNALIEAMAVGLPCISTDCGGGGAAALIQNEENGILIDRGDEAELTKQILRLMEDEALCEKLGNEAYGINERLDPEKVVKSWENVCKLLLKQEQGVNQ